MDTSGNAYVTGETDSSDFLTGSRGLQDALVVKLNPAGTVLYGTLIGGTAPDRGTAIAVDSVGSAYITGYTSSPGISTQGAAQSALAGTDDSFVAKLTRSGALSYFTYLGGANHEMGYAIAVDGSGNAYVAGMTTSADFPVTSDGIDKSFDGLSEGFLSVLNADGSARAYSSFLGGSSYDLVNAIALDGAGAVFVAGTTKSLDFPTTTGAFATAKPNTSQYDSGFVTKFLRAPSWSIAYSTYFGGTGIYSMSVNAIAVDGSGRAVVAGGTTQSGFPTSSGALKRTKTEFDSDVFLVEFNSFGSSLVYSTLLGGLSNDFATGLALDSTGALTSPEQRQAPTIRPLRAPL